MDTHGWEGVSPSVIAQWKKLAPPQRPGPDWLQSEEVAKLWGVTPNVARHRLMRLVETGQAERYKTDTGRTAAVYYRIKE